MSDTVEVTPVNFAVTRRLVLFWVGGGGSHLSWGCEGVCGLTVDIYPSGPHNSPPCLQLDSAYKCCHSLLP